MGRDHDCGADRCDRTDVHEHNLSDYPCDVEGCDEAYPHELLREKHYVDEHPEFVTPPETGFTEA
jgi:hypothetical protein